MSNDEQQADSSFFSRRNFMKLAGVGSLGAASGCDTLMNPGLEGGSGGSQRAGWAERAPVPEPQSDAGTGVIDGKLYMFGGIHSGISLAATNHAFVYQPVDGELGYWKRIEDMPRPLWGVCGVAAEGKIFSFGGAAENSPYESGKPPTDDIFRYTPERGWENITETRGVRCPYPNWVMKGAYSPVTGLIYCVGGGTDKEGRGWSADENRIWTFDPVNEEVADPDWARMPQAKRWTTVALFEVKGRHYIQAIGGLSGGPTDTNFRFDLETAELQRMTPTPRAGTYSTHENPVINNRAYLTHGMFWDGRSTEDRYRLRADRYDPVTDTFDTNLPMPAHRRGGSSDAVIDGTLYVAGGHIKRYSQNRLHDCLTYNESFRPESASKAA